MEATLIAHGPIALFFLSFLAATVLPIGSEWLLIALIIKGLPAATLVAIATAGNVLGACTTYILGAWGSSLLIEKALRAKPEQIHRAMTLYKRYGSWSLLLSWLPVVGDGLCLAAGLLGFGFTRFICLVSLGKFGRYAGLAAITVSALG